nr:antitermination protein NusB [Rhodanobacter sp. LX-99]
MSSFGRRVVDHLSTFADGAPWFVGWGTLALINAALAQGKNRSGLLWFLLSLLFGPLATLLLVLLPKVRSKMF